MTPEVPLVSAPTARRVVSAAAVAALAAGALAGNVAASPAPLAGSATAPYLVPVAEGVSLRSLLTTGELASPGHAFVGVPDGLGITGRGRVATVLVNHELTPAQGIVRAHGQKGAFVDRLRIDTRTGEVLSGEDLISTVQYWDYANGTWSATPTRPAGATAGGLAAFTRFCSGHLTELGVLSGPRGVGYDGQIYFANEESGDEGRTFGVTDAGTAYQLPALGLFSWENTLEAPVRSARTVVLGNEDANPGQIRVYVGDKQRKGNPVERAGLTNGSLFVLDALDEAVSTDAQFRTTYGKGTPAKVTIAAHEKIATDVSGAAQNADAAAKGLSLNRIEDGAFDPNRPNDYYFLTTEGGSTVDNPAEPGVARDGGGLWRLSFTDVTRPEKGGTLTLLLDGSEAPYLSKPDNMDIDREGHLLIQEDPGANDHVARVLAYDIRSRALATLASFDPALFGVTNPAGTTPATRAVLTTDEESSGIIDTERFFGEGTFLLDAQVHTSKGLPAGTGAGTVEELVEGGQLLVLKVHDWDEVFDTRH
jgi:hypothetical protein